MIKQMYCIANGKSCDALRIRGKIFTCKYSNNMRICEDHQASGENVVAPKWCIKRIISQTKSAP